MNVVVSLELTLKLGGLSTSQQMHFVDVELTLSIIKITYRWSLVWNWYAQ